MAPKALAAPPSAGGKEGRDSENRQPTQSVPREAKADSVMGKPEMAVTAQPAPNAPPVQQATPLAAPADVTRQQVGEPAAFPQKRVDALRGGFGERVTAKSRAMKDGSDQQEPVLWKPEIVTDDRGQAKVTVRLPDEPATYRVLVDGHTVGGRIGAAEGKLVAQFPFRIEPRLPAEATAGDRIGVPVSVVNGTMQELPLELSVDGTPLAQFQGSLQRELRL
jgi:hypothetical protein